MSTTTYKVQFTGRLSGKRFHDAVKLVKDAGGNYDGTTKTWTVVAEDETRVAGTCYSCQGAGHPRVNIASRDGQECQGGNCKQFGPHKHTAQQCPDCDGTGTAENVQTPRALELLRTAAQSYDAEVTAVDDGGRAALEAERASLAARIAEIDKLLA